MEHILTEKSQSCCAAGDQIIRKNKKGNSDSINQIAKGNNQKIMKGFLDVLLHAVLLLCCDKTKKEDE